MKITHILNYVLYLITLKRKRSLTTKYELMPVIADKKLLPLSEEEKAQIANRRFILGTKPTLSYWKLYKSYVGFNADYIADDDFMPIIIRCLNSTAYYRAHQNKSLYPISFSKLRLPETYVNSINGILYDGQQNVIDIDDAVNLLIGGGAIYH